ncbi:MAG: glutamate ABC transporter substrate-binding protein [Nocardiopsaceae bacterium]|nr:glutamate ABC transporter substrate-binding protein [Nocardiopsaceae bacterium]
MTGRWRRGAVAALVVLAGAAGCAANGGAHQARGGMPSASARPAADSGNTGNAGNAARGSAGSPNTGQGAGGGGGSCTGSLAPSGPPTVRPGSTAAKIRASGKLIAGVDQSTYHFGFLNPIDNKIEGFDIDMIDAIAKAIFGPGYQSHIEFKSISDAQRIPDVKDGSVDIVAHTMTISCDRWRDVDFSSVYFLAHQRVLVPKNSTAKSLHDLAGQKVCATTGSDSLATIARYGAKPVSVPYWTDCLVKMQQGQVAGISTDDSILDGLAAQDPFTKIIGPSLEDEPYGLAISKAHPDFVRFVNAVLAQLRSDGQWKADYRRWVGSPAPAPPPARYTG